MINTIKNKKFVCPVCGYSELDEEPWDKELNPSWGICPSCGTHFGNYDFATTKEEITARHDILRQQWISQGMIWDKGSSEPPTNWNPREQLKNIPKQFLSPNENY
ncbi:MAG: hypothetical protein A3C84_02225 [Candidatus Ryanbacteria bacterium RIFCSPHIGHO2_02_FULL_48_12]|uniref:Uncharacterized protein n=1 Tax=Candidatus Ryanbacteria bacterium RIFCSPHIGHO2_01_FULL_48_27 TaxID=1802115 RepID=A0A1G2G4D0_9BACT|nr:MAG: hypothetical protein A2756_04655 [Candidatus Ryanbacteria bacterium RIFCSPHIGHO2_01_FULL_48_27]OGZ49269.1 MAG: hypothetical protein A3C84_02225 [Candidatus Ryanbacteria bacterium RIFCSPHIGHO2_02_FULL_48_12]